MRGRDSRWILRGGSYNKKTIEPLLLDEDNIILISEADTSAIMDQAHVIIKVTIFLLFKNYPDVIVSNCNYMYA